MADDEKRPQGTANAVGCAALILLWGVLLLHFFADRIWDEEPAVLKWVVIGYGCLVLLGLLGSLVFGKRDERIVALVLLAVVAVAAAVTPRSRDRRVDAAVDALVADLSQRGAEVERHADSLPPVTEKSDRDELERHVRQTSDHIREQSERTKELHRRAEELLPRAGDKRQELSQALALYNERVRSAAEKWDRWIAQVRERVQALKK